MHTPHSISILPEARASSPSPLRVPWRLRAFDRFFYCAPACDHLLTHTIPFFARISPCPLAHPHGMPHGCPYQLQHPPQSSFPSHNPCTPVPSCSTSRYNLTSPPTTITVSRVFTPASRRRPQMFQLYAPRNATLSLLSGRPAIVAIITTLACSASSAVPANSSAVARPC